MSPACSRGCGREFLRSGSRGGHGEQPREQKPPQPQPQPQQQKAEQQDLKMLSLVSCVSRVVVLSAAVLVTTSITMSGEWGEEGVTYGQLGKDVMLTCARGSPGSPVEWRWSEATALPAGSIVQQGQLLLPRAERSSEGTYSCHDANGLLLSSVTLRLGRVPGLPSISCRASNYENFSCVWASSVETFLPTRYITTYRKKHLPGSEEQRSPATDVGLCIQDPIHPFSCTVSKSGFWSSYRMNVTEVNPLGSSFRLLDIIMKDIIKPDPPEGLRVEPVPSAPRRLWVSWEYPSTWPKEPHFQLRFRLQYRPVIYTSWSVVETANVSEVITDAFMGLEHVVQVSAKDFLDAGNWSEWSAEAWGVPAEEQAVLPSETATVVCEPEGPAEEPSLAPNEPIGRPDPAEKVAVLVSLGVFAFLVLAVILAFAFLMWIRLKKNSKEAAKNRDLIAAAIHMKALPKAQIL
uniref:Interleukin-11 receptor subunit alpha isoform X2 n=1 Tax=Pogona vitticeps TaxID=103695 RepID=A0ABM5FUP9_9SAUR